MLLIGENYCSDPLGRNNDERKNSAEGVLRGYKRPAVGAKLSLLR